MVVNRSEMKMQHSIFQTRIEGPNSLEIQYIKGHGIFLLVLYHL